MDSTVPWFLDRLEGVRSSGNGWKARCPAHLDKHPSLEIDRGGKGWLLYCHRGCSFTEIMGSMLLPTNAAFYDYEQTSRPQVSNIDVVARKFFGPSLVWCRKPHSFQDVGWATYPVDFEKWVVAGLVIEPESSGSFEDGMRLWITSGEVWLHSWLSERWLMYGGWHKIGWTEFVRWMHDQMWATYLQRGCSGSLCGEYPSLDQESQNEGHTTRRNTQLGKLR